MRQASRRPSPAELDPQELISHADVIAVLERRGRGDAHEGSVRAPEIRDLRALAVPRHGGVARELLKAAIAWLARQGAPRVMLWTATQNVRAQQVFEQAGFRRTMIEMTLELDSPRDGTSD